MLVLMLFAVVAGAGTAVTPCVLPVLPVLLSASATGGRRRPFGIVVGLAATYTVTIVALASVVEGVGLGDDAVRSFAIAVLFLFGLALLVPFVGDRIEGWLSARIRFGPRSSGTGFWSGLAVGGALGLVYAPCAGPVLAAVISVSATRGSSIEVVAVALSYSLGSAAVLLVYAFGSRRLTERIRRAGRGLVLQRAVGVVMIATAIVMLADLDVRFQTALANHFPGFLTNPTRALERSDAVEKRLAHLRGRPKFDLQTAFRSGNRQTGSTRERGRARLSVLGKAPNFTHTQRWFNTGGRSLSLSGLRGRVVLIDFWTYTCINCIRTFPALRAWDARYRGRGLTIVGVHTPEFSFERDAANVEAAIRQNRLHYPVVQDNRYGTWNAYGNQFWPAKYLIDSHGNVRYSHFGEGDYDKTEAAIRTLLQEAGNASLGLRADARPEAPSRGLETPETYLGADRAEGFLPNGVRGGVRRYGGFQGKLPLSHFAFRGVWNVGPESATAVSGASLDAQFGARKVFLVLSSRGGKGRTVQVLLDGKPIVPREAGQDVRGGKLVVRRQRLYRLVSLPRVEQRRLTLRFESGVSGYAFTFG